MNPFESYLCLLLKWNKTYNLTGVTDPEEIRIKHFEDALSPLPYLPQGARLLDIGTGAGFPGIPLKISRPDLEVVLLDGNRKKIAFCDAVIRELKLSGIESCHGRAEDPKTGSQLGSFDIVISRATFALSAFLEMAKPYPAENGLAIAMKSRDWEKEWRAEGGWKIKEAVDYELSGGFGKRTLILLSRRAV